MSYDPEQKYGDDDIEGFFIDNMNSLWPVEIMGMSFAASDIIRDYKPKWYDEELAAFVSCFCNLWVCPECGFEHISYDEASDCCFNCEYCGTGYSFKSEAEACCSNEKGVQ